MRNDGPPVDLRLHAALEIITVLYDAVDMQCAAAGVGNLDGFLRPLVRIDPPEKKQVFTAFRIKVKSSTRIP